MNRSPRAGRPLAEALERRTLLAAPAAAPRLPAPPTDAVWVSTVAQLQTAVANLRSGQTVVVRPGTYNLTQPLRVGQFGPVVGATIRGATGRFGDVVIRGAGGWEDRAVGYGFWVANAQDLTIADLSIGEVY